MRHISILSVVLLLLMSACIKEPPGALVSTEGVPLFLKMEARESLAKNVSNDAFVDPQSIYVLLFDGSSDDSRLLELSKAQAQVNGQFTVQLKHQSIACYAYVIANVSQIIEVQSQSWVAGSTLKSIRESLYAAALPLENGVITAMPMVHPMVGGFALPAGIQLNSAIGTADAPVELERATTKLSLAYVGGGGHFEVLGINLGQAPSQGFIFPDVHTSPDVPSIPVASYGGQGDLNQMIAGPSPLNPSETEALYAYESSSSKGTYVILKAKYNGIEGYYRIDLYSRDKREHLPLLRNYYYRITVSRVMKPGHATPQEAIDHPEDNGLNTSIEVIDPFSHEIISDGVYFMGISNSELWIYDSYVINEFFRGFSSATPDRKTSYESTFVGNGFVATTLTYASDPSWSEGKVTADNGIRFRKSEESWSEITPELTLEKAIATPITRDIIIMVPHDFKQGTVTIRVGPFEKQILIKREEVISVLGDVLDLGTGFSLAKIDFGMEFFRPSQYKVNYGAKPSKEQPEQAVVVSFSTSPDMAKPGQSLRLDPSEHLYAHVAPAKGSSVLRFPKYGYTKLGLSEFYLTRDENQTRVKVHLLREPFTNDAKDNLPTTLGYAYNNAFWRNDQTGERLIIVSLNGDPGIQWTARVLYGDDFIRITKSHRDLTTSEIKNSDAEDFQADETWGTFVQSDFINVQDEQTYRQTNPPSFRIALTSKNTSGNPRYGMILISIPLCNATGGNSLSFWVYVRQGEEADYVIRPTDYYNGQLCLYARKVSPYNLTVPNPEDHPGGAAYADHKLLDDKAIFTEFPSQLGYLFQYGSNRALHPRNPVKMNGIADYTYDYDAPVIDICPDGYEIPVVDHSIDLGNNFATPLHTLYSIPYQKNTLCADGYCDRIYYPERSESAWQDDYMKPAWMQGIFKLPEAQMNALGPLAANHGTYYVNPETLQGVFIPSVQGRTPSNVSATREGYWGALPSSPTTNEAPLFTSTKKVLLDRSYALPIRCVQK